MIEQSARVSSLEATLQVWRAAAEVVASDPIASRRQAYQDIIAIVHQRIAAATTLDDIIALFGRSELHAIAISAALSRHGRVLNAEVVVGAACWHHLSALISQRSAADTADDGRN